MKAMVVKYVFDGVSVMTCTLDPASDMLQPHVSVANASSTVSQMLIVSVAEFVELFCQPGFFFEGTAGGAEASRFFACGEDGQWPLEMGSLVCQPIPCWRPPRYSRLFHVCRKCV